MNRVTLHAASLFPEYEAEARSAGLQASETDMYRSGAVYTKPEIVRLILNLSQYTEEQPLFDRTVLEPGCGECGFLSEIISRLMRSFFRAGGKPRQAAQKLEHCITGVDIDSRSIRQSTESIHNLLQSFELSLADAKALTGKWLLHRDFLLHPWDQPFEYVIGNPPYIRIEDLPKSQLAEYRRLFATASNRSDLYICFFELGLKLLSTTGTLGFICTNRFVKNQYGAALRALISSEYRVRYYLDLEHTQPFEADVSAYPAIFIIDRERGKPTRAASIDSLEPQAVQSIQEQFTTLALSAGDLVSEFSRWYEDGAPWISTSDRKTKSLRLLEDFPVLESSAKETKAGIGVATGADKVFIVNDDALVEKELLLPLALAADISNQRISWSGNFVINPFRSDGSLVDLRDFPLLDGYFESNAALLRRRHVAKRDNRRWYRTIDRIWPELKNTEKLLIPDIQTTTVIGHDEGQLYPHHNLYYIVSSGWDLKALKTILRSSIVLFQMKAMSVQMRGGAVRFQTQALRKIRLPAADSLTRSTVASLRRLSTSTDMGAINDAVSNAYGFTQKEIEGFRI